MIEISLPIASHRRLFSLLADRQSAAALLNAAVGSSSRRQTSAKTNPSCHDRPSIRLRNATEARSILAATLRRRPPAIFKSP
jgi:hypothetical protein